MNAKPSEENKNEAPTICRICFYSFASDPKKRPRVLTCGHSFCHNCLKRVMTTEQENICPSCKQKMNYSTVEEVPVNYELLDAANFFANLSLNVSTGSSAHASVVAENMSLGAIALQKKTKEIKENELKYEGHCSEHYLPNNFKCMDCSLWICGNCQFIRHKTCKVVLYEEAVMSLKNKTNDSIDKLTGEHIVKLKVLTSKIVKEHKICEELTTKLIITENQLETHQKQKEEEENIIKNLREHRESVVNSQTVTDFEKVKNSFEEFLEKSNIVVEPPKEDIQIRKMEDIKLLNNRLTVLDPLTFCRKNNVKLCQELPEGSPVKYGRIEVGTDDRIRIHSFEESTSESDTNPIQFENLLCDLNVELYLPLEAFFKVYRGNKFMGEFIVEVDSWSPRGINFILGASGILHNSYRGEYLYAGNDFVVSSGNFPALVEDMEDGGIYSGGERRGSVYGMDATDVDLLSHFWISKQDFNDRYETIFGRVTKGMEVVDQIEDDDSIEECGLII